MPSYCMYGDWWYTSRLCCALLWPHFLFVYIVAVAAATDTIASVLCTLIKVDNRLLAE